MFLLRPAIGLVSVVCLAAAGCSSDSDQDGVTGPEDGTTIFDAPWPDDMDAVLTRVFTDGAGDQEQMPPEQAGPPYEEIVEFPPVDVTEIKLGVEGDFMYMRVTFVDTLPTNRVPGVIVGTGRAGIAVNVKAHPDHQRP